MIAERSSSPQTTGVKRAFGLSIRNGRGRAIERVRDIGEPAAVLQLLDRTLATARIASAERAAREGSRHDSGRLRAIPACAFRGQERRVWPEQQRWLCQGSERPRTTAAGAVGSTWSAPDPPGDPRRTLALLGGTARVHGPRRLRPGRPTAFARRPARVSRALPAAVQRYMFKHLTRAARRGPKVNRTSAKAPRRGSSAPMSRTKRRQRLRVFRPAAEPTRQ